MVQHTIPEELRRFVLMSIPSVPYLEALLLLRAQAECEWPSHAVAERLYISEKAARSLLTELCRAGMAAQCGGAGSAAWRYWPASDKLRELIDRLADLYTRQLVEVTILIHSKLDRKAQQFADAFKWRKDS